MPHTLKQRKLNKGQCSCLWRKMNPNYPCNNIGNEKGQLLFMQMTDCSKKDLSVVQQIQQFWQNCCLKYLNNLIHKLIREKDRRETHFTLTSSGFQNFFLLEKKMSVTKQPLYSSMTSSNYPKQFFKYSPQRRKISGISAIRIPKGKHQEKIRIGSDSLTLSAFKVHRL